MKFWNLWSTHLQLGILLPTLIHSPLQLFASVATQDVKLPTIPSPLQKPLSSIIAGWHSTHIGFDNWSFSAQVPLQYGCFDISLKLTQWLRKLKKYQTGLTSACYGLHMLNKCDFMAHLKSIFLNFISFVRIHTVPILNNLMFII